MSASSRLSIGAIARRTGCTVATIRYYEEIGLLALAHRTQAGQRSYEEAALKRLTFVRRCRELGFSIDQVRELLALVDQPQRPCADVLAIATGHLAGVQSKIRELQRLEASLSAFVRGCDTACAGGVAAECTILDDLALPSEQSLAGRPGCCGG